MARMGQECIRQPSKQPRSQITIKVQNSKPTHGQVSLMDSRDCQRQLKEASTGSSSAFSLRLQESSVCSAGGEGGSCEGDDGGALVCPSLDNPGTFYQATQCNEDIVKDILMFRLALFLGGQDGLRVTLVLSKKKKAKKKQVILVEAKV